MSTAQQIFVDQFVTLINTNANMNSNVIASSPSAGLLRITQKGTADPVVTYLVGGSNVSGAGTFASRPATGSPKYAELYFSWTLQPGDTVKLNAGVTGRTIDLTYSLPLGTAVDAGGLDHTTVGGGGGGGVLIGGGGVGSAQNRRLVVMECGAASTSFGSLFALDPQDATGIPIPTFRVVSSLPAAGSQAGESVYVTATRQGYVWDGTAWRDITASPIRSFPSDPVLQANTTEAVGTYAVASDTGNMYVRTAADGWRRIGVAEFATYADLNAWDAALGTEAICRDLDVLFLRVDDQAGGEKWIPISEMVKTEAQILAAPNVAGLAAIASDTGATYVNNGTRWIQDPIEHYATETDLLAATPIDGHLAWADDTGMVFIATGGVWKHLEGPQVSYGTTAPTTNAVGDFWYDDRANRKTLNIWTGTDWVSTTGVSIGDPGAKLIIPGYFNENPSGTATADDIGGLAFRYNGGQTQLFLNKGGAWNAMTPMLGDTNNAGKIVVADNNGNMTWGVHRAPKLLFLDSTKDGAQNSWSQDFDPRPTRFLKWEVSGACNENVRLMLIMQVNNGWWNWNSHLPEAQAMTSYEADGMREELAAIKSGWWKDNSGGRIIEDNGSYQIGANTTWHSNGHILFAEDRATLMVDTSYTSDNSTPMRCIFRARWDVDMRDMNKFGFKYPNGTGWFLGHFEYY